MTTDQIVYWLKGYLYEKNIDRILYPMPTELHHKRVEESFRELRDILINVMNKLDHIND